VSFCMRVKYVIYCGVSMKTYVNKYPSEVLRNEGGRSKQSIGGGRYYLCRSWVSFRMVKPRLQYAGPVGKMIS
jgi:hypothetical protein